MTEATLFALTQAGVAGVFAIAVWQRRRGGMSDGRDVILLGFAASGIVAAVLYALLSR